MLSNLLREGKLNEAEQVASAELDLNAPATPTGDKDRYRIIKYWQNRTATLRSINNAYKKAQHLLSGWVECHQQHFYFKAMMQTEFISLRYFLFEQTAFFLNQVHSHTYNRALCLGLARSYKEMDDYATALEWIKRCYDQPESRNDAEILAELADILDVNNDSKMAKLFFREAFFIDPMRVELSFIESPIVIKMIETISKKRYNDTIDDELRYQIPIYANIYQVFNITRDLTPTEVHALQASIDRLEHEGKKSPITVLKLINRYLWLIDFIKASENESPNDRTAVSAVLNKINVLNPTIYRDLIQ